MISPSLPSRPLLAALLAAGAALLAPAPTALAQPFSAYMGTWGTNSLIQQSFSSFTYATQVKWFRITIAVPTSAGRYYDFLTEGSTFADTELAIYDAAGTLRGFNDDWETGTLHAAFSFGQPYPRRHYFDINKRFAGDSGNLAAGDYYIAVLPYATGNNFGSPFVAVNNNTGSGTLTLSVWTNSLTNEPLVVTGLPNPIPARWSEATVLRAIVDAGNYPTSTGIVVGVDLSSINGGFEFLNDQAISGDAVPGDSIFSGTIRVPGGVAPGTYTLPLTATDLQGRVTSGSTQITVLAPIGLGTLNLANPTIHQFDTLSPGNILWYEFNLGSDTDASHFMDINTIGSTQTANDTVIGLYNSAGVRVGTNDDWQPTTSSGDAAYNSMLSYGQYSIGRLYAPWTLAATGQTGNLPAGTYRLGVTGYPAEFNPNMNVVTSHNNSGAAYVNLYTNRTCSPADIVDGGGLTPGDGTVDGSDYVAFVNSFAIGDVNIDPLADVTADGTIDGSDFIIFINAFAAGC